MPKKRLSAHLAKAKSKPYSSYKNIWINQLLQEGRMPALCILDESNQIDSEEKYIQYYKAQGMVLLNMTHNGKDLRTGGRLISKQEVEKIKESLGLPFTITLFE